MIDPESGVGGTRRWLTGSTEFNSTRNRFDNATLGRGDTLLHHKGVGYNVTDGYLAFERAKALVVRAECTKCM
jgi:hypothetical protein